MTKNEYELECSLINSKYQLQLEYKCSKPQKHESSVNGVDFLSSEHFDAYDFVTNNTKRVIQLSTIAKLLTDNKALIEDFPIEYKTFGMEPYNNYAIKVCDTYGTALYVFVHYLGNYTYLFPIVSGFNTDVSCSPLHLTANWRVREIKSGEIYTNLIMQNPFGTMTPNGILFDKLPNSLDNNYHNFITVMSAEDEFGFTGEMIRVDNIGIYGNSFVLSKPIGDSLLTVWKNSEDDSLYSKYRTTTFSSLALVLQVWLHTITMWRKRCVNRKIKIISSQGNVNYCNDIKSVISESKQTIVDINKDIVVYVNDHLTKREFQGYHMRESERCGHFRHLKNGNIIYIPPTIVHYKKLVPDKSLVKDCKPIIYRNTEDFLREKSYLESEVNFLLQSKLIAFEREKMFSWMGKKRLDFYLPDKNIGIECQGVQHFYPYGSKDTDFKARQQRDKDKYNECVDHDVTLIYYVNPDIPVPKDMSDAYLYITNLDDLYSLIT